MPLSQLKPIPPEFAVVNRLFENTTQSYKFLWGMALLEIVNNNRTDHFDSLKIRIKDITAYSCIYALRLKHIFKIRLSARYDSLFEKLTLGEEALEALKNESINLKKYFENNVLKSNPDIIKKFTKDVPYQFVKPCIAQNELSGKFHQKQKQIKTKLDINNPPYDNSFPYKINYQDHTVNINPCWRAFFQDYHYTLKMYFTQAFGQYLNRYNIDIPNLFYKVDPAAPAWQRELTSQRELWQKFITEERVEDIFDDKRVTEIGYYALDHFIPWNFVAHNQLWNLTPIEKNLNSIKSDQILIPSSIYYKKLAEQQFTLFSWLKKTNRQKWLKDYVNVDYDLLINEVSKQTFIDHCTNMLTSQANIAIRQGFQSIERFI